MFETNEIISLPGVGPTLIERLQAAGINNTEDLQKTDFHSLTAIDGIGSEKAVYLMEYVR